MKHWIVPVLAAVLMCTTAQADMDRGPGQGQSQSQDKGKQYHPKVSGAVENSQRD